MVSIFQRPGPSSAANPAAADRRDRWNVLWLALLVVLAGLAATVAVWRDAKDRAEAAAVARFEYHTGRIRSELVNRLEGHEAVLRSAAGLIGARTGFDRSQWRRYFQQAGSGPVLPGHLLTGFVPRVPRAHLTGHELIARADGLSNYAVRTSADPSRPELLPLAYIHASVKPPPISLGEDMADDPVAAEAMADAGRSGRAVLAGPLAASPSPHEKDQIWAIFVPVYGGTGAPASDAERAQALMGYMIGAFNAMEMAGSALGPDASLIGLKVVDGTRSVFTCTEMAQELDRGFTPTRVSDASLHFGGREWSLRFVALPGYLAKSETGRPDIVLASGALVSVLLGGLVGAMARRRARALQLVDARTAELRSALARSEASETRTRAVVDNALDGIITIDEHGIVQSFNPAAERIFGYAETEVVGSSITRMMTTTDRDRHAEYIRRYLATGERRIIGIGREVTGQRKNGETFPMELGVSEMRIGGTLYFCGIVRDVTGRRQAEMALLASESKLRSYIDQSIDGVLVVDQDGRCLEANPAAQALLGRSEAELRALTIRDTMDPDPENLRAGTAHFQRVVETGRSQGEVVLLQPDGTRRIADINAVALGGERYLGLLRDVTERHEASLALQRERELLEVRVADRTQVLTRTNAALQQEIVERRRIEGELVAAREQALQAAEAKAGFMANMSHEIRTPMNAVIGMTALLEETPLNAEQRDYVETIRTSGDALLTVINEILDFSKVESGRLELERRPFDLAACIEEAVDMLAPRATEKGIDLLYVMADDVPEWIVGDNTRLRQVFVNLLSNAVKFTERGEVCLTAAAAATEPGGHDSARLQLRFEVRDTGVGIPLAQQRHLFKAFTQADSSTTRKYGGTGLGLAICQRLVQLMGGSIGIDSEPGRGSTFTFTIATEAAAGMRGHGPTGEAPSLLSGRRVLLVDDNATNLRILDSQCKRWGLDVSTACSATEALAVLDGDRLFDAAVLDLQMPQMDGERLAQQIRWLCPGTLPALVLLSSTPQRRDDASAGDLFAARLTKPVKHSQLLDTLIRVLHVDDPLGPQAHSSRRLDRALAQRLPLKILVVEDSAINRKLAVGILAKLGYGCDVATHGAEALEMVRHGRHDLVFMDLQMPVMDGLEATRRIRAEFPAPQPPRIVAMTANALSGDRERCLAAGMDDYIAKPVLPVDVQALIEHLPRKDHDEVAIADDESTVIDRRTVDELREIDVPGQPSLLRSLLEDYLTETPTAIADIRRHADRREASQLAQRAHKLAGVSASVGASGMAKVCVRVEQLVAAGDLTALAPTIDRLDRCFARTRVELLQLM